jgi:hypothetical protein
LQLPDAVHKLEDEISKLIKTIDTAMLKEATTEDLASIGQQGAGNSSSSATAEGQLSEMDRLQKLPGYDRLQRQLFYNLMTARPDISDVNIRVHLKKKSPYGTSPGKQSRAAAIGALLSSTYAASVAAADHAAMEEANNTVTQLNEARPGEPIADTQAIDRATIKNISKLIIEKDPNNRTSKSSAKNPKRPTAPSKAKTQTTNASAFDRNAIRSRLSTR